MTAIEFSMEKGIATLTFNRPAVGNAIDLEMVRDMHLNLDRVEKHASGTLAVVISGGKDVFSGGVDLHSVRTTSKETRQRAHLELRRLMDPLILRMSRFRLPLLAAVNGAAVGAGMSLALATDIVVAGESAYFHPSFARLGMVPDAGITSHLARRVGIGRSLSSLLLAEKIDARTAVSWGLAYEVVPDGTVFARTCELARKLATGPCLVLAQIRSLQAATFHSTLKEQLRAERSAQEAALESANCAEGVRAFFEKREPEFKD